MALLELLDVEARYGQIRALQGVTLSVGEGDFVALLGANGAGKTTTLKAISNLLRAERGDVTKGQILYRGARIDQLNPAELVKRGIRDDYIVLVGGAPLNEEFGKAVGADAYCRDAAVAAETAQALVLAKRAMASAS